MNGITVTADPAGSVVMTGEKAPKIRWQDSDSLKEMSPTDTFEKGHEYNLLVDVMPSEGYYVHGTKFLFNSDKVWFPKEITDSGDPMHGGWRMSYGFFRPQVPVTKYDVWVNGEQFNEEKLTIACGSGKAVYDPAKDELALTDATITNEYSGAGIKADCDISIILNGTNKIDVDNDAIDCTGDLSVSGSGDLNIDSKYGICEPNGGNVTIGGSGIIKIECDYGIYAQNDIAVTFSNTNNTVPYIYGDTGIYSNAEITLSGEGDVYISGIDGIHAEDDITLTGSGSIDIWGNHKGVCLSGTGKKLKLEGTSSPIEIETYSNGIAVYNDTDDSSPVEDVNSAYEIKEGAPDTAKVVYQLKSTHHAVNVNVNDSAMGTASAAPNPAKENETVILTATPNTGYRFKEWQSADVDASTGSFTMPAKAVSVTAVFEPITTVITLDKQGGVGGDDTVTAVFGSAMPTAAMPTQTGFLFAGYFDAETDGDPYYGADGLSIRTWDKEDVAVTLYAHWTKEEAVLTGINISKAPGKTDYVEGEAFDGSDMIITAAYSDGSTRAVTDYAVKPSGALTTADTVVEISYTEKGITKSVQLIIKVTPAGPVEYKIIAGADQTIYSNASSAQFVSDADFSKFDHVEVDGKTVAKKYYTAESGSTDITFNQDFISTLSTGKHTLTIVSTDGSASTVFTVTEPVPKTGDSTDLVLLMMLMLLSGAILMGSVKARKMN